MKAIAIKQPIAENRAKNHIQTKAAPASIAKNIFDTQNNQTLLQRKANCTCGGGCPRCQDQPLIQPKLKISAPGDQYEQEADHVAEQIQKGGSPVVLQAKPIPNPPPKASCKPESEADAIETAAANKTLAKSQAVASTIVNSKSPSDLAFWFAQLYYYITLYEIREKGVLSYPAFTMHFIPIFYDLYSENVDHFMKNEKEKIGKKWQEHFDSVSAIVDPSQLYPYAMAVTKSIVSGVRAHIEGDMHNALRDAYLTYFAKYCDVPPFDTYYPDFFDKNMPIFEKVRTTFLNDFINRGLGMQIYGRRGVNPEFAGKVADLLKVGLNIKEIYNWRNKAWGAAKDEIKSKLNK